VLGAVAILGVGLVGYSIGSKKFGRTATEPVKVAGLDDMSTLVKKAQGVTMGPADASVTIAEFADFMCPACRDFDLTVKPQIVKDYVDPGKVKYIFYDFPLVTIHPNSFIAARAARCAEDQDKFWAYQDVVYRNQPRWAEQKSPMADLLSYGDSVGLDEGQFTSCVKSDRHADLVSANLRLATELGLDGTPTIMVSAGHSMPVRLQSVDFKSIKTQVDSLLAATSGSGS
jgi:protein-disulfide isomerase